jgi:DNA (cytosine-5)-methyltransferase 1
MESSMGAAPMRVIDLFCGCGGLSLGARKAGLEVALSVDVDPVLTASYRYNHPHTRLINADISTLRGKPLCRLAGGSVDGVIGGPPCQGFSEVGLSLPNDPRRQMLGHFFRLVKEITPRFFLMENVRGLAFSKNREELFSSLSEVSAEYNVLGPIKLDAASFGAPTTRPRVFVIGFHRNRFEAMCIKELTEAGREPSTVRDAIFDLQSAVEEGVDAGGFDWWRYDSTIPRSAYARLQIGRRRLFTGQRKVTHRPEVIERFASVPQGGKDPIGRHVRLHWEKQCPTLRAGTGPEKGSFQSVRPIHPTEPRVITVREAARLQGFPDGFIFHPTQWHSFRMIGNSVSPIIAEHLLRSIVRKAENIKVRRRAA